MLLSRVSALAFGLALLPSSTMAQADLSGVWELEVAWPQKPASVLLAVQTGDSLRVTWTGPRGQLSGQDVEISDGRLTFTLLVEDQEGNPVELRFEGRETEGTMMGRLLLPKDREIAVTGRRRSKEDGG